MATAYAARCCRWPRESAGAIGFSPQVVFEGSVDTIVDRRTATELLATVREALSNVARHAWAHRVQVEVEAGDDVVLRVTDDGVGVGDLSGAPGYGVRNMRVRAEDLHGSFTLGPGQSGGTVLEWRVPAK